MSGRIRQSAYDTGHPDEAADNLPLQESIRRAMRQYLISDLGLSEEVADRRSAAEAQGAVGAGICDEIERAGIGFEGKVVLDLGAGLGAVSAEVAKRRGIPIGIEPGSKWRALAAKRVAACGEGCVLGAVGEQLPFADNSIDLIVSRQVLEHVKDPAQVIREAFRVLKPGGFFALTYENYLSFWEPHYRVRWLPLLPKRIGAAYLRLLGRDPTFLMEAVTYTTFPSVRRQLLRTGFECVGQQRVRNALRSNSRRGLKWRILGTLGPQTAAAVYSAFDYSRRLFRTGVSEWMQKPPTRA